MMHAFPAPVMDIFFRTTRAPAALSSIGRLYIMAVIVCADPGVWRDLRKLWDRSIFRHGTQRPLNAARVHRPYLRGDLVCHQTLGTTMTCPQQAASKPEQATILRRLVHLCPNGQARRVARLQGEAAFGELSKELRELAISDRNRGAPARYSFSHEADLACGLSAP